MEDKSRRAVRSATSRVGSVCSGSAGDRAAIHALVVALFVAYPSVGEAYCRTRHSGPQVSSCPERCSEDGPALFWGTRELRYAFDEAGFPELDDDELRATIQASFDSWASASCGGAYTGLLFTAEPEPVSLTSRQKERSQTSAHDAQDNVIAYLEEDEWRELNLGSHAYALTLVRSDASGEIHGADILFNGGQGPLGNCPEQGCQGTPWKNDLANVATHEAGHFLGLSHSDVPRAAMYCSAPQGETLKRHLDADDVAGLCAIYPPAPEATKYRLEVSPGCTLLAPEPSHPYALLGLSWGALVLTVRRGRRCKRTKGPLQGSST